jgi:hypothetical protein
MMLTKTPRGRLLLVVISLAGLVALCWLCWWMGSVVGSRFGTEYNGEFQHDAYMFAIGIIATCVVMLLLLLLALVLCAVASVVCWFFTGDWVPSLDWIEVSPAENIRRSRDIGRARR